MKRAGEIVQFLKSPPLWFCALAWVLAALLIAGAIAAAAVGGFGAFSYVLYAGAAVFLAYTVYSAVRMAPKVKAAFTAWAEKHRFTENLLRDYGYRTIVLAVCSFVISAAYVVLNAVLSVLATSVWYASLAGYYLFLSGLRFGVLFGGYRIRQRAGSDEKKSYAEKLKLYRNCGIALLVLETALVAAVTQMVRSESPAVHTQIMAIASAAYTFYKVAFAIRNLVKVRRYKDPLLQSFRNINLTDASVSLIALQTTLVAVFSEGDDAKMNVLNAVTGFAVCALTIVLGIWMIVSASRKRKEWEEERCEDGREE